MKVRKGLAGGQYKPLSNEDIDKIHRASMEVFSEVGVQVNYPDALERFAVAGAEIDSAANIVRLKEEQIESFLQTAPSEITLYGRDETGIHDLSIGGNRVYMGTGGTALNVQEPGAKDSRRAELRDVLDMARMVECLENIHFYMLNVYPGDLPVEEIDVNRFGAALNRTRKHVMGGVYTVEGVRNVIRMAEEIAGSSQALREHPFISMVACPISPFKLDESYGELAIEAAMNNIPVVVPAEPLCGATAPITLAGNLVIQNVDTLAGIIMTQLANPGAPAMYGCISSITDLRDMKYLAGAVEMGLMNAAGAQMAQFYKLPYYATAGMTDSKAIDAQAGYESAITSTLVAMAGANFIHDAAGFVEFCMTASYDKLVVDNEIIGMVMRAVDGIEVNDRTLALDEIKKVGPGGHFVSSRHTRKYMRSEQFSPQLSNRDTRKQWLAEGSPDAWQRASAIADGLLASEPENVLPEDIRVWITDNIPSIRPFIMQ
jgi:trimethylamine--corrinoid protein Co-methyltransferase